MSSELLLRMIVSSGSEGIGSCTALMPLVVPDIGSGAVARFDTAFAGLVSEVAQDGCMSSAGLRKVL